MNTMEKRERTITEWWKVHYIAWWCEIKETSAKLYDIIWLDNVNNYDLLQLTWLRIWAFGLDHPIDYWRSRLLAQLHQVQSRWSEDEIEAYLCGGGPKWFMTNRSLLFCKKCKQDPRTKSTKAKKDHTATKKTKKVLPPISTFSEAVDEVNFDPTASGRLFSAVQNIIGRWYHRGYE